MKKLIYLTSFLMTWVIGAQENQPAPIFMNVMLTPQPDKIEAFEAGLAAHNKKFHADEGSQISVFWIASGKDSGKYIWSLGPTSWVAMDQANDYPEEHTKHWNAHVAANAKAEMETTYWKGDMAHSNFSKDFGLKNLSIFMLDIKRFKQMEFIALLDKVQKVFKTKDPDHQWGAYFNELSNNDGQDMVWVDFFEESAWMGQENKFPQWYEEVHGDGSFSDFLKEFEATTDRDSEEIWIFRSDLSSSDGQVQAITGE